MDSEQLMQIFRIAVYISIAITVLGFGSAVFIFFRFDIRTTRALMTGKVQAQTVAKMLESGDYKLGKEEEQSYSREIYTAKSEGGPETEAIGRTQDRGMTVPIGPPAERPESQETTVLQTAPETTVLESQETTVLGDFAETTVLKKEPSATADKFDAMGAKDMKPRYVKTEAVDTTGPLPPEEEEAGETALLSPGTGTPPVQPMYFVSTEHTMLIHTDEVIG